MTTSHDSDRLSRIGTQWSLVLAAHADGQSQADRWRRKLLSQYSGAVYRYVLAAVRDGEAAEDLCQDFAVRLLKGDLRAAAPQKGRFRDYVKTVLINLVNDYWRARAQRPLPLIHDPPQPAADDAQSADAQFSLAWRTELLDRTWKALEQSRPNYFAVLRARVENPDSTSRELAEQLTARGPTAYSPELFRKTLERAHAKFADLLVEEVAESLDSPSSPQILEELQELDLLKYCRKALERRAGS